MYAIQRLFRVIFKQVLNLMVELTKTIRLFAKFKEKEEKNQMNKVERTHVYLTDEEITFHGENYQTSSQKQQGVTFESYLENELTIKIDQCNLAIDQ